MRRADFRGFAGARGERSSITCARTASAKSRSRGSPLTSSRYHSASTSHGLRADVPQLVGLLLERAVADGHGTHGIASVAQTLRA
ncbi:hypothetical protein [Nocardia amamiensis]|uniref:imine reductase family protein n=1 Tax=Nocardia TaxID=1817 RepID=UPI0033D23F77